MIKRTLALALLALPTVVGAETYRQTVSATATSATTVLRRPTASLSICNLGANEALSFDILGTPLNVHFSAEILLGIFDRLGINIVATDTPERLRMLQEIRAKAKIPFGIVTLEAAFSEPGSDIVHFGEACKRLSEEQIASALANRRRKALQEVATVMFTSGSTGSPKGVSFSIYNLVTKRFARAAALPQVGGDEVLLCYLPLFHTFGRYLEMLGSVYWGGTYVFVGNPG